MPYQRRGTLIVYSALSPAAQSASGEVNAKQDGARMIDRELLDILVCPETKQPVSVAEPALVERVNAAIERGTLTNRGGEVVKEDLDGGLVREDGKLLYPIREDIPIMLIDEAILLEDL